MSPSPSMFTMGMGLTLGLALALCSCDGAKSSNGESFPQPNDTVGVAYPVTPPSQPAPSPAAAPAPVSSTCVTSGSVANGGGTSTNGSGSTSTNGSGSTSTASAGGTAQPPLAVDLVASLLPPQTAPFGGTAADLVAEIGPNPTGLLAVGFDNTAINGGITEDLAAVSYINAAVNGAVPDLAAVDYINAAINGPLTYDLAGVGPLINQATTQDSLATSWIPVVAGTGAGSGTSLPASSALGDAQSAAQAQNQQTLSKNPAALPCPGS